MDHKTTAIALAILALGLTLTQGGVAAKAQGHGAHGFHSGHHYAGRHRGPKGIGPLYGGVVAFPPYAQPAETYTAPAPIVVAPPPAPLTCHRTVQTVTVPVEGGGTKKITVTRC